jgi:hypothetical protein
MQNVNKQLRFSSCGFLSNESSSISLLSALLSRCVSVKTRISNSSTKFWRKLNKFIYYSSNIDNDIAYMDMNLSDKISPALNGVLDITANSDPGLDSIL